MSKKSVNTASRSTTAESTATLSVVSTCSALKPSKCEKHMHWWYFGPVLLAIVMFLLMGTVFERRIEALWRRILERRQAVLAQTTETQDHALNSNSLHAVKTPSQRTIGSCKAGTTTAVGDNDAKLECKSFCCNYIKKEHKDEDLVKKDVPLKKEITSAVEERIVPYPLRDFHIPPTNI